MKTTFELTEGELKEAVARYVSEVNGHPRGTVNRDGVTIASRKVALDQRTDDTRLAYYATGVLTWGK